MVFPVVMYGCESWTVKKAEHQRIDVFELWYWRRLLRVPWLQGDQPINPRGNQPWIVIGRTDAEAETPILWPPDVKSWLIGKDWCWEGLGAGGEGDDRGWDGWMASLTWWMWVSVNSGGWWWTGRPGVPWFMGSQRVGHDWATELNWTEYTNYSTIFIVLENFFLLSNVLQVDASWLTLPAFVRKRIPRKKIPTLNTVHLRKKNSCVHLC